MWLHRFAVLTAVATYILLIVGGLVHGTGSSLACPDWPLCHGQFFPRMTHGVEYEHSHRLVAGTVAMLTVILAVMLYRDSRYRALRPLAIAAPVMVLAQALLGGLTVIFRLPKAITLSHLTLSMCFFSVVLIIAVRTAWPTVPGNAVPSEGFAAADQTVRAKRWTLLAVLSILGQILIGGFVRHSMAGLACIDFPLCFGHVWPPESSSSGSERIHMLHRFGAVAVTVMVITAAVMVYRAAPRSGRLRKLAIAAPIVVLMQVTLGVLSVTTLLHLPVVTTHLGVGALLLACMVSIWTLLPGRGAAEASNSPSGASAKDAVAAA